MKSIISHIKKTGATFTPNELANFLAKKLMNYNISSSLQILDPSCGEGALLAAISELYKKKNVNIELTGYDSNQNYLSLAKTQLQKFNNVKNLNLLKADFLDVIEIKDKQLSIMSNIDNKESKRSEFADIVIANPPYVRTQILGSDKAQIYSKKYNLKGRVDLYYPFIIAMTNALKNNGILGVITSNRYLSTKSGESIRKYLFNNYEILEVIDLGDTKLFNAAVLPAIFIGRKKLKAENKGAKFQKIYEEFEYKGFTSKREGDVFELLNKKKSGYYNLENKVLKLTYGKIQFDDNSGRHWSFYNTEENKWINTINKYSETKIKNHFKVRVGIKSNSDKVFIRDNWDDLGKNKPEKSLLKEIISQENIRSWNTFRHNNLKVLYPHYSENGVRKIIDLNKFPKAKLYLDSHKNSLEKRTYLIKSGRQWFELWVPQNPKFWKYPKLVFPDISTDPRFYFDDSGRIVNGNCYWIMSENEEDLNKLLIIQGIANSKLMTKYHDLVFKNKLYSGRRRYFSQYVENYPLPNLNSKESELILILVKKINNSKVLDRNLLTELDKAVELAYGFNSN